MKISEIFDQWGIFTALQNKHPPWENDITALTFDIYYKTSRGEKICTPFLEHFAPLSESKIGIIATFLIELYGNNWSKEYNTLNLVYNPIENYRRIETEHSEGEFDENNDQTETPTNRKTTSSHSGYENNNLTKTAEVEVSGTVNVKTDRDGTNSNDRTLDARGNIGITTTQSLIQQERDLIVDCTEFYVRKFAEAFNLSMEVNCYGWF